MTLSDPHLQACLSQIRQVSDGLADEIATLTPEVWQGPTNCPPWTVRELATHLVTSGQGFVASIRNGLSGSTEPLPRRDPPGAEPVTVARALRELTDEFVSLYTGLSEAQLEMICFHRRGDRSVRWYAAHRLAEVAFHGWDLLFSLRGHAEFSADIAKLLLPMLLESNVPRTYAAGLSDERGRGERYSLSVLDDPSLAWTVTIGPDVLTVTRQSDEHPHRSLRSSGEGAYEAAITAPAATLALLVYGRTTLADPMVRCDGNEEALQRFPRIFPRP